MERFRRGFMPNSTIPYLRSMTQPNSMDARSKRTSTVDVVSAARMTPMVASIESPR